MLAEIERVNAGRMAGSDLIASDAAMRTDVEDTRERKAAALREKARLEPERGAPAMRADRKEQAQVNSMAAADSMQSNERAGAERERRFRAENYLRESQARTEMALEADIGVVERLVWFWSNHFCVSGRAGKLRAVVGAFEREAIRPHILGRFSDMLLAVESHPAMLVYLDNEKSFGPNSRFGRNRNRGLNENLAREILELHTLGVRSVYSQADVTTFAKILTGWTIVPPRPDNEHGGRFRFNPDQHEPGAHIMLGKTYADAGFDQGRAVLADIARHPATARHIATKLVLHFVADSPPQDLVKRLTRRFLETDGDLKQVTRALLQSDEAWTAPRAKLKRPSEWIIGVMRTLGANREHARLLLQAQDMLGEPLWRAPSPRGFSDQSSEWLDGVAERLDIATHLSRRLGPVENPFAVLEQSLGSLCSETTKTTIARAEDRTQALTLLFMAPEFQLR
jgi:uncharacterized protein (DUF1800 family)